MSEKYTSQLFSSKKRSRVVKVDICPKFYSSACSFSFPTFFPYFPPPSSHSSYLMGVLVLCCPLALWIINTPGPSCTVGQETPLMRTCTRCHYNEDHLSIKPGSERTCSKAICKKINTHTHSQPQSGPGLKVKGPCFLSRQTRAEHHLLTSANFFLLLPPSLMPSLYLFG